VLAGQCIECGTDWQTVAHGGWINVCDKCQPIRRRRTNRIFAWAFVFMAAGFVVTLVTVLFSGAA
jgi:hypothetical protein